MAAFNSSGLSPLRVESLEAINPTYVVVFNTLQLIGLAGTAFIFATALMARKTVKRDTPWITLSLGMMLFSLAYSLLFISGQQSVAEPPFGVCMAQAILIYSTSVFGAFATLGVTLQLLYRVRVSLTGIESERKSKLCTFSIIILPYVVFAGVLVESSILGVVYSDTLMVENGMHCGIVSGIPGRISAILVLAAVIAIIGAMGWIVRQTRRSWRRLEGSKEASEANYHRGLLVRLGVFSLLVLASILAGSATITGEDEHQGSTNLLYPCMSILFCLIFGSQRDMVDAWAFWRK